MKKQITKKQHFVPKCFLKHFTQNDEETINIFDINICQLRTKKISEEFYQNYFYDRDNEVEDILQSIESNASPLIDKIIKENKSLLEYIDLDISNQNTKKYSQTNNSIEPKIKNKINLLKFINLLLSRTPVAQEKSIAHIQAWFQSVSKESLRLNHFNPDEAKKTSLEIKKDSGIISSLALGSIPASVLLFDMSFHLVKNRTSTDFFIADHPAFSYNWFYRNLKHPEVTGIHSRGFQLFLPLSPKLLLCLYDSKVYKYGSRNEFVTNLNNPTDIEILNSFQIFSAKSIIGFSSKDSDSYIKLMFEKYKNIKIYKEKSIEYEINEPNSQQIKTRHTVYSEQTKLDQMPSFVKIKKNMKYQADSYCRRSPELIELHEQISKE